MVIRAVAAVAADSTAAVVAVTEFVTAAATAAGRGSWPDAAAGCWRASPASPAARACPGPPGIPAAPAQAPAPERSARTAPAPDQRHRTLPRASAGLGLRPAASGGAGGVGGRHLNRRRRGPLSGDRRPSSEGEGQGKGSGKAPKGSGGQHGPSPAGSAAGMTADDRVDCVTIPVDFLAKWQTTVQA